MTDDQLRGWKEIATFLGTSERTAQRWESELQLPVHRLSARPGASVFALRPELVVWRSSKAGRVAARQEAERAEREKNLAASAGPFAAPARPAAAETPSGALAQPVPSARQRRYAMILAVAAGILALAVFFGWFTLRRAQLTTPQPTPATAGVVKLRILWPNGPSMRLGIPDGGTGRLTVGTRLLQFGAKRTGGTVKLQVSEVRPGSPGQGETVSFLGEFVLRPGATMTVEEPSPFTVEWMAPAGKNGEPAR